MLPTVALNARAGEELADEPAHAPRSVEPLEWLLVAWPELLAAATWLLGSSVACPGCGRRGVVVRVVSMDAWDEEDER